MSLFENDRYRWRETYFVLFQSKNRPTVQQVQSALKKLGNRFEVADLQTDESNQLKSLTLLSPLDYAAMDVTYLSGDEVVEQVSELKAEMKAMTLTPEERVKLDHLTNCDARFDVYHFEQLVDEDEDDEILDPGGLLIVLECLAGLCDGVCVDPQTGGLL